MKNVAIVGGGLSGLTCAFALKERGIPATVFEASSAAGGRCPAAAYLLRPELFSSTFHLVRSLNLHHDLIEIPPIAGQYYKGRVYHHRVSSVTGLLGFKGLHFADKAMLSRMAYVLIRYGPQLDFHHPERGAALDDETTASFVKRELSQNILNYVAGPLISTLFYYTSDETSRLLYLNLAKFMYNIQMFTLRAGLGRITTALAERVALMRNEPVESLQMEGASYVVNGTLFSDLVIAVPGNKVLALRGLPGLVDDNDKDFFERCEYGRALTVTVDVDQEVDRCYALSIPRVERLHAFTMIFHDFMDSSALSNGRRVTVVGGGNDVTPEGLVQDFARIYRFTPSRFDVKDWTTAMPKFPPGRYRQLASFLSRSRRPGLWFCGDYLMGPFIEAAVTTGYRAAEAISLG
jgi:protoporphyrinogen oxidase